MHYSHQVVEPHIILWKIRNAIEHTCLHEEEPCHSERCIEHIIHEVDEMHEDFVEARDMVIHISHYTPGHIAIIKALDDAIDHMIDYVDHLHERLRIPTGRTPETVQAILKEACTKMHGMYHELVNSMKKMHVIHGDLASEFDLD